MCVFVFVDAQYDLFTYKKTEMDAARWTLFLHLMEETSMTFFGNHGHGVLLLKLQWMLKELVIRKDYILFAFFDGYVTHASTLGLKDVHVPCQDQAMCKECVPD